MYLCIVHILSIFVCLVQFINCFHWACSLSLWCTRCTTCVCALYRVRGIYIEPSKQFAYSHLNNHFHISLNPFFFFFLRLLQSSAPIITLPSPPNPLSSSPSDLRLLNWWQQMVEVCISLTGLAIKIHPPCEQIPYNINTEYNTNTKLDTDTHCVFHLFLLWC